MHMIVRKSSKLFFCLFVGKGHPCILSYFGILMFLCLCKQQNIFIEEVLKVLVPVDMFKSIELQSMAII